MRYTGRLLPGMVLLACAMLVLTLAAGAGTPVSADGSLLGRAMESAVRIEIALTWPGQTEPVEVGGSGWTRSCTRTGSGFQMVVATAGHVVDLEDIEREAGIPAGQHATAMVTIVYRDGKTYTAGREDLRLDRERDYGEIRFSAPIARNALPVGNPGDVMPGDPLVTVASPGAICFGVFPGHLILRDLVPVTNAPAGCWLSSIQIGPGASGAPVLDARGNVVATVIGIVTWQWGGTASVLVPIPTPEKKGR